MLVSEWHHQAFFWMFVTYSSYDPHFTVSITQNILASTAVLNNPVLMSQSQVAQLFGNTLLNNWSIPKIYIKYLEVATHILRYVYKNLPGWQLTGLLQCIWANPNLNHISAVSTGSPVVVRLPGEQGSRDTCVWGGPLWLMELWCCLGRLGRCWLSFHLLHLLWISCCTF